MHTPNRQRKKSLDPRFPVNVKIPNKRCGVGVRTYDSRHTGEFSKVKLQIQQRPAWTQNLE